MLYHSWNIFVQNETKEKRKAFSDNLVEWALKLSLLTKNKTKASVAHLLFCCSQRTSVLTLPHSPGKVFTYEKPFLDFFRSLETSIEDRKLYLLVCFTSLEKYIPWKAAFKLVVIALKILLLVNKYDSNMSEKFKLTCTTFFKNNDVITQGFSSTFSSFKLCTFYW